MERHKELDSADPGEVRMNALQSNATAVRAVAAAVEGTLGPKGLDTMLVNGRGEVVVTNDGVTILERMDVKHPAAQMVVNIARAQQEEVGDGTTTATLLAAALVDEGVKQVKRGVPVAKVIAGIQYGVRFALEQMQMKARPIWDLEDEWLQRIAFTAGREQEDITNLVMEAAHLVGREKLLEKHFKLSETVVAHPRAESGVFFGVLLNKGRLNVQMPSFLENPRVLVVADALEPEQLEDEVLRTEAGFSKYMELKEAFRKTIEQLVELGVGLVVVGQGVDPVAEEILTDASVIVVNRIKKSDLIKVAEHTGARMVKRTGLDKSPEELEEILGSCTTVQEDERFQRIRITGGTGKPSATILVGAATEEVVGERERICKDAAAAVQAALRGGFIPGGGATELALARDVEKYGDTVQGMEGFGIAAVAEALQRPMAQVVANAGFNPLEKVEEVKALQWKRRSDSLGIDCERGSVVDMIEMGVVDSLLVKYHALQAASEVSTAILRIHTVVRMRDEEYLSE